MLFSHSQPLGASHFNARFLRGLCGVRKWCSVPGLLAYWAALLLALQLACVQAAHGVQGAQGVPTLDLRTQTTDAVITQLPLDLRSHWQSTRVAAPSADATQPYDAEAVWQWPASQFEVTPQAAAQRLNARERWIGRLALQVAPSDAGLMIDLPMPRLDIAHISYRYDNQPWVHLMAGDQIPMVRWPFAHRSPAFPLPAKQGLLQIVLELGHEGLLTSPVHLISDTQFRDERFTTALRTGSLSGLALVLSFVGFGAALVFRRFGFVAVALLMLSVALAVFAQGGVAGMYVATQSPRFNDASKFVSGMLCGLLLPWAVATVLSQKSYAPRVWQFSLVWLALGLVVLGLFTGIASRVWQSAVLPPYLLISLVFAVLMAVNTVVRGQPYGRLTLAAVLFVCLSLIAPLVGYWGLIDGKLSMSISSAGFLVSTVTLFFIQLMQYRHGSMVMARANSAHGRDVLTGLLNRASFEHALRSIVKRLGREKSFAAFLYVEVRDAAGLKERFDSEGFEVSMVQIAAAISSCVSVVDIIGRIAPKAFAVTVIMPRNQALATALAQKIITRTMTMANHSTQMLHAPCIALAWIPVLGTELADLERSALEFLRNLEPQKRIGWVSEGRMQLASDVASDPVQGTTLSSVPGIISSIERDMLGASSEKPSLSPKRPA